MLQRAICDAVSKWKLKQKKSGYSGSDASAAEVKVMISAGFFGVISKYAIGRSGFGTAPPSSGEATAYENQVAMNSTPRRSPSEALSYPPGPCTVPDFTDGRPSLKTVTNKSGEIGPLNGKNTWSSTDCGFIRLSYDVGLHRVVDSVYRFARSAYFYQGQSPKDHEAFQPLPLTATGNNAMAPIDMASGMQTILNVGLHHDPYYVQWIDGADGTRFYFVHSYAGRPEAGPDADVVVALGGEFDTDDEEEQTAGAE